MPSGSPAFFNREAFSDITIKFSGQEIKCHKMILCSKSEYFNKLCGPESPYEEGQTSVVELFDGPADAVEEMLAHLYTFDYTQRLDDKAKDPRFHLRVYFTAKKYMISYLERQAYCNLFNADLDQDLNTLKSLLAEYEPHKGESRKIDKLMESTVDKNLGRLMATSEYRARIGEDDELWNSVVRKLGLIENLSRRKCLSCSRHRHGVVSPVGYWNPSEPSPLHSGNCGGLSSRARSMTEDDEGEDAWGSAVG